MIRGGLYWEGRREDKGRAQIRGQKGREKKREDGKPRDARRQDRRKPQRGITTRWMRWSDKVTSLKPETANLHYVGEHPLGLWWALQNSIASLTIEKGGRIGTAEGAKKDIRQKKRRVKRRYADRSSAELKDMLSTDNFIGA